MFQFANIAHLDDVRHAISEDFYLAEREWGFVINYHISAFPEIKDDMTDAEKQLEFIRREFRGIKFDIDGNLIARPFHKFFNWGEKEAEMVHFDFNQPFVIMDKLDGSMIHPMIIDAVYDEDLGRDDPYINLLWCSKMGPTDVGNQAARFVEAHPEYLAFAEAMLASNLTPIFEWCSRQQRIVVDYPEDALILTAVRNIQSGQYMAYEDLVRLGVINSIPVVKAWNGTFTGINEFVEAIGGEQNCEGYIIRFANGHMVKLKNAWYLNLHRAKDQLSNEKNVWRLILEQQQDDLIPHLDDEGRKGLEGFAAKFQEVIIRKAADLDILVAAQWELAGRDRKTFAINYASKHEMPAVVFKVLDGKTGFDALKDYLMAQTQTQAKMDAARHLIGGIKWKDYYYPVDMDA